jgi:hypothetical protein
MRTQLSLMVSLIALVVACEAPEPSSVEPADVEVRAAPLTAAGPAPVSFVSDGISPIEAQPIATQKAYYRARAMSARQALATERAALSELDRMAESARDATQRARFQQQASELRDLTAKREARIAAWDDKAK